MSQEQFQTNGCKANSICIWMPITRQDRSPCVARKAAGVNCMDGISLWFLMLWLKSFLEQQVLFTVKLTAGASWGRQLYQNGGNGLFYTACIFRKGKLLSCKSFGHRVFFYPEKGTPYHGATRWEARRQEILYALQPASTLTLPELWNCATKIRPNCMRSESKRDFKEAARCDV